MGVLGRGTVSYERGTPVVWDTVTPRAPEADLSLLRCGNQRNMNLFLVVSSPDQAHPPRTLAGRHLGPSSGPLGIRGPL